MLAARGVSLGLGKINLADLNSLPRGQQQRAAARHRKAAELKKAKGRGIGSTGSVFDEKFLESGGRIVIKKQVDKQTLWAACRAVVFGSVLIALGGVMTVVGYFDEDLSTEYHVNSTSNITIAVIDHALRYQFKSLQYIGPIIMGVGSFILMIACVMTLESRDKHTQIVHEMPNDAKRRSLKRKKECDDQTDAVIKVKTVLSNTDEQKPLTAKSAQSSFDDGDYERKNNQLTFDAGMYRAHDQPGQIGQMVPQLQQQKGYNATRNGKGAKHQDSDSGPYSAATTLTVQSKHQLHTPHHHDPLDKCPSASCIDDLSKQADTRALMQRFLDDQSRMVDEMRRRDVLQKQGNSLEVQGSAKVPAQKRNAKSQEITEKDTQ